MLTVEKVWEQIIFKIFVVLSNIYPELFTETLKNNQIP